MNWTLEVVVVPVSDIDLAKEFYANRLGFNLDHDIEPMRCEEFRGPRHRFIKLLDRLCIATIGNARHQMQPLDAGRRPASLTSS